MSINPAALERLRAATFGAKTFVEVMEQMSLARGQFGAGDVSLTLDYQTDGQPVKAGDMIPYITIGLRQATVPATQPIDTPQEES